MFIEIYEFFMNVHLLPLFFNTLFILEYNMKNTEFFLRL